MSDPETTGLKTSPAREYVMPLRLADIAFLDADCVVAPDLTRAAELVAFGAITTVVAGHGLLPGLRTTSA